MPQVIIPDILPLTQAIAVGGQTVYSTNWTANYASDVVVYSRAQDTDADDETQILNSSQYSVAFIGDQAIVQVTLVTPSTQYDVVTITRNTPADRLNLYTNTNFTPTMLNQDFGILTFVDQQAQLVNQQIGPRYNYSAFIEPVVDTILPILPASSGWMKNSDDTAIIPFTVPASGIAPAGDAYVLITSDDTNLPNSFGLDTLQPGILINNPSAPGLLSTSMTGTNNQITISNPTGVAGPINIGISLNPLIPGTAGMGIPNGTTGQRVVPSSNISLRFNTSLQSIEYWKGSWVQLIDDQVVQPGLASELAWYATAGQSISGLTTVNYGVLITSGSGVPSWLANGTTAQVLSSTTGGIASWQDVSALGTVTSLAGDSGSASPVAGVITVSGASTGLTTSGSGSTLSFGGLLNSTYGGTGLSAPTAHGIMIGEGASPMTPIVLSSGQILIGSTGVDPVAAAINSGTGILVGNGAGSITVSLAAIASHTLLSNITAGSTAPISNTLTATIDAAIGSTQGNLLYRNSTVWTVLAPGTSGQLLQTGGAAANPAYTTATYPATTTINQLLYSSSANTVVGLPTANSAVLVTSSGGVPSLSTTLPAGLTIPGYQTTITPAALTKADDTNVTLTLGGTPATALLQATSLTLGWTGTLSGTRGGTGVNNGASTITLGGSLTTSGAFASTFTMSNTTNVTFPTSGTLATTSQLPTPAALTKTDDTNVTLSLGGTPTTALLQATSLTLGWTGTLSGTRGGTGVNNGASTITLGGSLTTSGAFASTFTMTNTTSVTFPTSGTLATTSQIPGGAALTKTDDTNVTLTLGGSPTTALVNAASLALGWTGQLGLTRGGTAASLTASNGGIVYSTASALAILAGTATAGLALLSGASTTPTWSSSKPITRVAYQQFTASGTYTPSSGMTYCIIETVGGGGAGGGATSGATNSGAGGGGGSGGYSRLTATAATIGASQTVTIGTAGAAGSAGNNAGGNGGDTSVGSLCIGKGGTGGAGNGGGNGASGGAGGVAGTGDLTVPGETGWDGTGNTITTCSTTGGHGGSSRFGGGARGISTITGFAGLAASNYGSGGSGGISTANGGAVVGGVGTAGLTLVTEFLSV